MQQTEINTYVRNTMSVVITEDIQQEITALQLENKQVGQAILEMQKSDQPIVLSAAEMLGKVLAKGVDRVLKLQMQLDFFSSNKALLI